MFEDNSFQDNPVDDQEEDQDENISFQYSITSYGADYPVDGLVKRVKNKDILIPPFQRSFVWNNKQSSRFLESLLLGLPVPGIFLSKDYNSQKLLVIDGQQRLKTLQFFYDGLFAESGKEFSLQGVQPQFDGLTYKSLDDENRRRLDDSIIHATIVKQDEPSDNQSSIYHIFERLNTGGRLLLPHEIRSCIYHGEFNDLLKKLNQIPEWREIFGPIHPRMRDQELILRFIALYFDYKDYKQPMKGFLNNFMGVNRHLSSNKEEVITKIFSETIKVIHHSIGSKVFKPKQSFNAAVFDSVMIGVAKRLSKGEVKYEDLKKQYENLLLNNRYITACETHTSHNENVCARIDLSMMQFENIK